MIRILSKTLIACALAFLLCITFWKDVALYLAPVIIKDFQSFITPGATGLKFKFKDKKETFYSISACKSRDIPPHDFEFEHVSVTAALKNGKKIEASADYALYNQSSQIISLKGHIALHHEENGHLKTNAATIYIKEGYAEGDDYVEVDKKDMMITAHGFRMNDAESEIIFKKNPIFKTKNIS